MNLKLLLGLFFIVWRSTSAEEYTNHWLTTDDIANVEFCSHDGFKNGSCKCDVDYTGNFCLNRKCRNFGYDGQYFPRNYKVDRCICPPGFLGRNCEPVTCVPGTNQIYSSLKKERSVSLLATYNTELKETWKTGDIGSLICSKTEYWRNFNYNYNNANYYTPNKTVGDCIADLITYLDADPCNENNNECEKLNIENLDTLVQNSPPNSIIFVVTNMGVTATATNALSESIIATSIARRIQINVLVYNNTNFLATDPGLAYLSNIASATFGTFVLPSIKPVNEQYDIVNTLLEQWDQGYQVSSVFNNDLPNLPIDNSQDLYVAAQTDFGTDLTFNLDSLPTVVNKTDFWKLYKLPAETVNHVLTIFGQVVGTPVLVFSSGGLKAYSAFTTDDDNDTMVVDAAYSVSVTGASYSLVVRLESENGALDMDGVRTIGKPQSIQLGNLYDRPVCQFNYAVNAKCTSAGPSVVTVVTGDNLRSVSFPVYCANLSYAANIYNNLIADSVSITHLEYRQSFSQDFTCNNEIPHEIYGDRSFVIIAENTKDIDYPNKSSADNVFRNKNSIFYQLTDYVNSLSYVTNPRYSDFWAVLTNGGIPANKRSNDYDYEKFLTKVMKATSGTGPYNKDEDAVSVKDLLVDTIQDTNSYSDILFIVNYNITEDDGDASAIKQALEAKRSKLFVLFVQTNMQYTNKVYTYMNGLAVSSGGVAIRLKSYEDSSIFFQQYFPLLVANDIVAKAYSENQKAGIALNNVYLSNQEYILLVTNEDLAGDGSVNATVTIDGINVNPYSQIGELQLFKFTPKNSASYNIPVQFSTSGLARYSNAVLLSNTNTIDFISLSFVDQDGQNRNDVIYGEGAFTPVIYSNLPFGSGSQISITYSDAANPAKPIYDGTIKNVTGCNFKNYTWTTDYSWTCTISDGLYHFKIDRVSDDGTTISRTFPITCIEASSGSCLNGGVPAGDSCNCPLEWTGKYCESPRCLNGGTLTSAGTCDCGIVSFAGQFCEISISSCVNSPPSPDYRSDLSSLIIVADVQALAFGGLPKDFDFGVTGVPITVVIYGDENAPRIVQSTTNSQHLSDVLGVSVFTTFAPGSTTSVPSSPAPVNSDMYKALNLALDNQITNRAFIVVYTSNADVEIHHDFLIRLAVKRAEVRVLSRSGTESENSQTLSLVGNGIPLAIESSSDFQTYLMSYVGPLFQSLQYQANVPQRVFNVFKTGQLTDTLDVVIPADKTFDNAKAIIFVHVYKGFQYDNENGKSVGLSNIYSIPYNQTNGNTLTLRWSTPGVSGFYAVEIVGYLKTAYGFNNNNLNGSNEVYNSGVIFNEQNTISIYSAPFIEIGNSNPANFPYLSISEIINNGSLSDPVTVLFTRKNGTGCLYKHFATLNVCSQNTTIGYQVQLTTRTSNPSENRQQQFVLTCFNNTYLNNSTVCHGHGSPIRNCACDLYFGGIDCTEPVCVNGGVRDMSVCRCPVPYFGLRCERTFGPEPTSTSTSPTTTIPVTVTTSQSTKSVQTSQSTVTATVKTTQSTVTSAQTTTSPQEVRAAAFIIDLIGTDDYAFNQTFQSIAEYCKAFGYNHYMMLIGNLNGHMNTSYDFQKYADETAVLNRSFVYWNLRKVASRTENVTSALTTIRQNYEKKGAEFRNAISLNIFYCAQTKISEDLSSGLTGLEVFDKSSLVYSPFGKNADQAIVDSMKKFSPTVSTARGYYDGLEAMVSNTKANSNAVLPEKPNKLSCVYGLQCNIRVAIDRSNYTISGLNDILNSFLTKFRIGFNFIENDIDRCTGTLADFYNERAALTAFPYYDNYVKTSRFCPSQYTSMLSFKVGGSNYKPSYSDKTVKSMGKNINSADCNCNRFSDPKTVKYIIWLPRSSGPIEGNYLTYLKLNTTNAYHFVVPFYDLKDKTNDLYYQILVNQPKGGDYYLLPNAAKTTDATMQTDIIDKLYEKLCETAGVDPTAVPQSFYESIFENRHNDYYD